MARTWPVLHLRFTTPLDDTQRERLLLDVDDLGASALDETDDVLSIHFPTPAARDAAAAQLEAGGWRGAATFTSEDLPDEGWAARSQANLPAIRVDRVVVSPPWDRQDGEVVIEIEPSTGFGTGHHQSTRLCLRALQAVTLDGARVLDIGTGSGVLAIAAVALGAQEAIGIDNDPDAIESADDTLRRNATLADGRVRMAVQALDDPALVPADVVCANLTGTLLRQQGQRVQALIVPGGCAILSGFTEDEARWVREAFDACDVEHAFEEEFWISYVMRRRPSDHA